MHCECPVQVPCALPACQGSAAGWGWSQGQPGLRAASGSGFSDKEYV